MTDYTQWGRGEAFHGLDDEFKPRFEEGARVYFADRHILDIVDGEIFRWLGYDEQFGDRYAVFSEKTGLFYDVWEDQLTRMPGKTFDPAYDRAILVCDCVTIALFVVTTCGIAWWHSWILGIAGSLLTFNGLVLGSFLKRGRRR